MDENYFLGFKWSLPKSFTDALLKCFFNVGDIIYDTPKAYSLIWGEALKHIKNSIQIKSVSNLSITSDYKNIESVFLENWDSEVMFDFYSYPTLEKKEIKSTQGRLYLFLWKGDENFIFNKNLIAEKPIMLKTVFKDISKYQYKIIQKVRNESDFIFYFPVNVVNAVSTQKIKKIIRSFKRNSSTIKFNLKFFYPKELKVESADLFCPTIIFYVFEIIGTENIIKEALKSALYNPSKDKLSDKDRFKLSKHGKLIKIH